MCSEQQIEESLKLFRNVYEVCVSHTDGQSGGCFLLVKKSVPLTNIFVQTDEDGRLIVCDFRMFSKEWRIVCVYAPNECSSRCVFFEKIEGYLHYKEVVVLLGDFNCVRHAEDRSSPTRCMDRSG